MSNNEIQNNASHCKYFVIRKKRFCRMTVKSGYDYCGEHEPKSESDDNTKINRLRITCPLDNKHTCFASKLSKHLKKCNAQKRDTYCYIKTNFNTDQTDNSTSTNRLLSNVPINEILAVINKVNELYNNLIDNHITEKILHNEILTTEINNPEYGVTTKKHLTQTSSLLEHLKQANLLNSKTCFVEFGAGKGQLSYWLSKLISSDSSILLVERASLRHKLDNKLDKSQCNVTRIRADIADLVINEVETVKNSENVVGLTKHLCGEATDLALRCLINGMHSGINIRGLVMAFCCHHRCLWPNYVGKTFFIENGLNKKEFDIICGLVSWATCGSGLSREARKNSKNNLQNIDKINNRDRDIGLSKTEKELVGKKCKLLIDFGRAFYLKQNNFLSNLFYYVDLSTTLENVCVVAIK